jgi:hypothetical protein
MRASAISLLAASTMLLVSGCGSGGGLFGELHDISLEVTGTPGPASEVTYNSGHVEETMQNVMLPWKYSNTQEFLSQSVRAKPAKGGTVTCRIVIDGQEAAAATSTTADAPVECKKDKID